MIGLWTSESLHWFKLFSMHLMQENRR
jgi:hypothetical protein